MSSAHPLLTQLPTLGQPSPWLDLPHSRQALTEALQPRALRESWKYTRVDPFLDGLLALTGDQGAMDVSTLPEGIHQDGIRCRAFTDLDATASDWLREHLLPSGQSPLAGLVGLIADGGLYVEVDGTVREPLRLRTGPGCSVVVLRLAPGARLTVNEVIDSSSEGPLTAQWLLLALDDGASLDLHRRALGPHGQHYGCLQAHLRRGARLRLEQHAVGADTRRLENRVRLEEPEARLELSGASAVAAGRQLDQQLSVDHAAAGTVSRQRIHGIVAARGRATCNGRIHILPQAPGSDAALNNRNLALADNAGINSKPELEIYTDDVRCAHGATVGQLSSESLHYLRSRGIPEGRARQLLYQAFLAECVDAEHREAVMTELQRVLDPEAA